MTATSLPPVPHGLREMLKDYPELVERLQENLNQIVRTPSSVTSPFERAIWILEDTLGSFITKARDELRTADESGTEEEVARAREKLNLMLDCRSPTSWGDDNLAGYFSGQDEVARHVQ